VKYGICVGSKYLGFQNKGDNMEGLVWKTKLTHRREQLEA